jgi:hypothetical protein
MFLAFKTYTYNAVNEYNMKIPTAETNLIECEVEEIIRAYFM